MNTREKIGLWALRRHPHELLGASVFAARHRAAVVRTVGIGRQAAQLTRLSRRTLADPNVQTEARLAVSELSQVVRRARKLGMARALEDKQTIKHARQGFSHVSNAVTAATATRRKHSIRRPFAITLGSGALLGASCAGWKRQGNSWKNGTEEEGLET